MAVAELESKSICAVFERTKQNIEQLKQINVSQSEIIHLQWQFNGYVDAMCMMQKITEREANHWKSKMLLLLEGIKHNTL